MAQASCHPGAVRDFHSNGPPSVHRGARSMAGPGELEISGNAGGFCGSVVRNVRITGGERCCNHVLGVGQEKGMEGEDAGRNERRIARTSTGQRPRRGAGRRARRSASRNKSAIPSMVRAAVPGEGHTPRRTAPQERGPRIIFASWRRKVLGCQASLEVLIAEWIVASCL